MKEFESVKNCPACNEPRFGKANGGVTRPFRLRYHKSPVFEDKCIKLKELSEEDAEVLDQDVLEVSHLHVSCFKCGFEWIEIPYIVEAGV